MVLYFARKNLQPTPEKVRDAMQQKDNIQMTILKAFDEQIKRLELRVKLDISPSTVKKYLTCKKKVAKFLKEVYNKTDVLLSELNGKFILDLDSYLRTIEKLRQNAIAKNMQQLKRVIKISVDNSWLEKDPFPNYACKIIETDRGYLSMAEVNNIHSFILPNKRLEQTRDVFIFCCYTGLAYADLAKLNRFNL